MFRTLIPAGRLFGVDIRIHLSFPILLALALMYGAVATGNAMRGFGLWLALVLAVVVRETARALAALYTGMTPRAIFMLPVGGVMAFAAGEREADAAVSTRAVTAAGPIANVLCGLLLLAGCYALVPGVRLLAQPWISPAWVLRSFVWTEFAIAILGLVPSTLPMRSVLPQRTAPATDGAVAPNPSPTVAGFRFRFNVGSMLAMGSILLGLALTNIWLICLGGFFLVISQAGSPTQQALASREGESLRVRDVMLTEFLLLSSSDTLSSAMSASAHSLQDVFPVVRGDLLVGSIARSTIAERLITGGDAYLQGVMTRTFPTAAPEEKLIEAHRRVSARGAAEFVPVVEDDAVVGILTPGSLARAVAALRPGRMAAAGSRDE